MDRKMVPDILCNVKLTKTDNGFIREYSHAIEWLNHEELLHREDGPARIYKNLKEAYWFLNGRHYYDTNEMPLNMFIAYCKWKYEYDYTTI